MPRYEPGDYKRPKPNAHATAETCVALLRVLAAVIACSGLVPFVFLGRGIELVAALTALLSCLATGLLVWGFAEGLNLLIRIARHSESHRSGD
jgi:hypothetical protein